MAQLPKGGLVRGHDKPIYWELRHLLSRWHHLMGTTVCLESEETLRNHACMNRFMMICYPIQNLPTFLLLEIRQKEVFFSFCLTDDFMFYQYVLIF